MEFAGIVGNANAFMAMLMIGVGFHLNGDPSQIGDIIKILGVRYIIGIALALAAYFILLLPLAYRQALVIVFLAPVASANPPFTAQMGSDFGLASAINSVSIIASIVLIDNSIGYHAVIHPPVQTLQSCTGGFVQITKCSIPEQKSRNLSKEVYLSGRTLLY